MEEKRTILRLQDIKIEDYKSLGDFRINTVVKANKLFMDNLYNVVLENEKTLIMSFPNDNSVCDCVFEIEDNKININCDGEKDNEYVFATFLYLCYKYCNFLEPYLVLLEDIEFTKNNFITNYITFNAWTISLNKQFILSQYIHFLKIIVEVKRENLQEFFGPFIEPFFNVSINIEEQNFRAFIHRVILSSIDCHNIYLHLAIYEKIQKYLDIKEAKIYYETLDYQRKYASVMNQDDEDAVEYILVRLLYDFIDAKAGEKKLEQLKNTNAHIAKFYNFVKDNKTMINSSLVYDPLFFKRKEYFMSDLNYFVKYKDVPYALKERILKYLFRNNLCENLVQEFYRVLSIEEFITFFKTNFNYFRKSPSSFLLSVLLADNIDYAVFYLLENNFADISRLKRILEKDINYSFCEVYVNLRKYIGNYKFFDHFGVLSFFSNKDLSAYYIPLLIELMESATYRYINFNSFTSNYKETNPLKITNYNEAPSGYNDLKDKFTKYIDLDRSKFHNAFSSHLSLDIVYKIQPRTIVFKLIFANEALISSIEIDEEKTVSFTTMFSDQDFFYNYILTLILKQYYVFDYKKTFETDFLVKEEEKRKEIEREQKEKSARSINKLLSYVNKSEYMVSYQKMDLEINFLFEKVDDYINKYVSFRVGNVKYYLVKSISTFMKCVIDNEDYQYGKSFSFNHNLGSFNERSQKVIRQLLSEGNIKGIQNGNDNRYCKVSEGLFKVIFDNYDNVKYNFYHDLQNYNALISKEKIDLFSSVDKDYNLMIYYDSNHLQMVQGEVIEYYESIYLLNDQLRLINTNEETKQLYKYLINNGGLNVKYIKKEFQTQIYSRYINDITIDDDIKSEFELKDLDIEVYFDYNNEEICYLEKFYLEGKEINKDEVAKQVHLLRKYSKYNNLLFNFGFVNQRISDIKSIYQFLRTDLTKLKELAKVFLSENMVAMEAKVYHNHNVYMSYDSGLLSVCFEESSFSNEELYIIMKALRKKVNYIKLKDNVIIKVDDDAYKDIEIADEFNLDIKNLKTSQTVPLYQSLKIINELNYSTIIIGDKIKEMINDISCYKSSSYQVKDSLKNVMRDYQIDAYKWMMTLIKYNFSGILADDMGLGKSLEIISIIESDEINRPSLIVCPKSLIFNWQNEFRKWSSEIEIYPLSGSANERSQISNAYNKNKKQVFIISYDSLKNDLELFNKLNFRFLILDEAQFIKNHSTLKAQSVKKINSEIRFALTGTPIENSIIDLWSIFDFLMPKYLYNYSEFKSTYEKNIITKDELTIKKLVKKITPFILRRTKEEVLKDLPEKIEQYRIVEMENNQRKYYESQLLKTRLMIENSTNKIDILSQLTRLRQICVDPGLFIEDYYDVSAKYDALQEIFDEYINEHKIIVFSQFTKSFDQIRKMLDNNIKYDVITGETSSQARLDIANNFNQNNDVKVLLVSLKAGGTGLNLIGADIVVHLDPWWNVAAENQASDRAHRIGQTKVVQVIKILCKDSIEQKVITLQNMKKDLVDSIISTNDSNIQKLNEKDLKYLLE